MFMPLSLNVEGKTFLIVGGGSIAFRKLKTLLAFGVKVVLVSPKINEEIYNLCDKIHWFEDSYDKKYLNNVDFVIAATDRDELNEMIRYDCKSKSILCLDVGSGKNSDYQIPAIVHKDPIYISVSTQGESPAISKEIKTIISNMLDKSYIDRITDISIIREILKKNINDKKVREDIIKELSSLSVSELKMRRKYYENQNWDEGK